jgi:hypothetical protein
LGVEEQARAEADCNQEALCSAFHGFAHCSLTIPIYRTGDATTLNSFPSPANDKGTIWRNPRVRLWHEAPAPGCPPFRRYRGAGSTVIEVERASF